MRRLFWGALVLGIGAYGCSESSPSGGTGGTAGAASTGGSGGQAGGPGAAGALLGTAAMWSALPAGDGERAKQRTATCVAQCQTDGGCGFWDAAACARHCADPRLACQADLAPDACWDKLVAYEACKATLSCAELNQFYYHASEGVRPCKAEVDQLEATCGFIELVASSQCYGPSLTCSDGSMLSPYWVCDGDSDCKDGADESNCPWLTNGPQSTCKPAASIDGTDTAGDVAALAGVTCIDGTLSINGSNLTDLSGLASITTVGSLNIAANSALQSLHGLEQLKGIQELHLKGNAALTDLNALSGLTFVAQDLEISSNKALASLEGLHNIGRAGETEISGNAALTSLAGLRGLKNVDGLSINQNDLLQNLEGLGALQYFGPLGFTVGNNAALVDLSGLNVTSVGAGLSVIGNDALTSLKGLDKVKLLAWTVSISRNPMLASISALSAVTEVRGDVKVSDNPLLPNCQVEAWITPLGKTCACSGNDAATTCP